MSFDNVHLMRSLLILNVGSCSNDALIEKSVLTVLLFFNQVNLIVIFEKIEHLFLDNVLAIFTTAALFRGIRAHHRRV